MLFRVMKAFLVSHLCNVYALGAVQRALTYKPMEEFM